MAILKRTNQGGSTVIFVVIGVVLSIGLICAIYFVRQYGEQVRKDQAIAIYDKEQADKKASEAKNTDSNKTDNSSPVIVDNGTPSSVDETAASDSSELPVTGINLSVNNLIEMYILTFVIASYILSSRSLKRSL